jgi:hypothetical protein
MRDGLSTLLVLLRGEISRFRDFEISRFLEGAPTEEPRLDANNARRQRPATRAIGVSRALACVKHPWLPTGALHCPDHPSCAGA